MKIRILLTAVLVLSVSIGARAQTHLEFAGSKACETCHKNIYERWEGTLMANILVDVKERPDVIIADFSNPDPLVTFTKEDIVFTYNSVKRR